MKTKDFLNKNIYPNNLEDHGYSIEWEHLDFDDDELEFEDEEEYRGTNLLEVFLTNYFGEDEESYDAISLKIAVLEGLITDVLRLGHHHYCGGSGFDDKLRTFPTRELEAEATRVLQLLTTKPIPQPNRKPIIPESEGSPFNYLLEPQVPDIEFKHPSFFGIYSSVIEGDSVKVIPAIEAALDAGIDPLEIVNGPLKLGMEEVGRRYTEGDYYTAELLISVRAMEKGLEVIKKSNKYGPQSTYGRVVIGLAQDDEHDIGKKIVAMTLAVSGFEVVDLGVGISPEKFVDAIQNGKYDILAISAGTTVSRMVIPKTIELLVKSGLRDNIKVLVGGLPVTDSFARESGADGYGVDAIRAVKMAKHLMDVS